jgi:hypothetical protein
MSCQIEDFQVSEIGKIPLAGAKEISELPIKSWGKPAEMS